MTKIVFTTGATASAAVTLLLVGLAVGSASAQSAVTPGVRWVRIPAGTFGMGCVPGDRACDADEQPQHRVTITHAFELLATEVSIEQFRSSPRMTLPEQPSWNTSPTQPVLNVTWSEARAYCEAIGGRLPTEAEWEYAARGGVGGGLFVWGDEPSPARGGVKQANVADEAGKRSNPAWRQYFAGYDDGYAETAPVGSFAPNGYGVYDMAGNVWEWVNDWYADSYYRSSPQADPQGPSSGTSRVVRGGCWDPKPVDLRISNRLARDSMIRDEDYGFRCARDVSP